MIFKKNDDFFDELTDINTIALRIPNNFVSLSILDYLGFKNRYSFVVNEINSMHPGMSAEILLDREPIGFLGRVHPNVKKDDIFVAEFSLNKKK